MEHAPAQQEVVDLVVSRQQTANDTVHSRCRDKWDQYDRVYHAFRDFRASYSDARDRDAVMRDGQKEFGHELVIPYGYATVETILPRMVSHRPRILLLPRDQTAASNVANMDAVIQAQQERANYEVKLQTTAKSGLIYGLGVQKLAWRREERERKVLKRRLFRGGYAVGRVVDVPWDDWDVQDIDIYDFFWDPLGDSMETVDWTIHRTWRTTDYVLAKLEAGAWGARVGGLDLTIEEVRSGNGAAAYNQARAGRMEAQGFANFDAKGEIHEIWEYHNGERVYTVLDKQWLLADVENPAWHGEMPFHIFRPNEVLHRFNGKGEIEPIMDLQHEMDMLRTDRRWNALLKLHQAYFFEDGAFDTADVEIYPGAMIPVQGDPNRMLAPVNVGDIPNSGYREEERLEANIQLMSGISDVTAGAGVGAAETATGVQLVQAAANARIALKARRAEVELMKPEARQIVALNQQRIIEARPVALPIVPKLGDPERRWAWRNVGPPEIAGAMDAIPEAGSTAPENVPQKRNDAMQLAQLLQIVPGLHAHKLALLILQKFDIENAEQFLEIDQTVPPQTLDILKQGLVQAGMNPEMAQALIGGALQTAMQAEGQGPQGTAPALPPGAEGEAQDEGPAARNGGPGAMASSGA